jgi:hypothetical protein
LYAAFLVLKRIRKNIVINVHISICKVSVIFVRLCFKLEFSRQIFENFSRIECHENSSSGTSVVPYGQRDTVKFIIAFRDFAKAPKAAVGSS